MPKSVRVTSGGAYHGEARSGGNEKKTGSCLLTFVPVTTWSLAEPYSRIRTAIRCHGFRRIIARKIKLTTSRSAENGDGHCWMCGTNGGADIGSDHHIMMAKVQIKIPAARKKFESPIKRFVQTTKPGV
jgi:hypothetical protein